MDLSMSELSWLINLSFLLQKSTGISTYAKGLIPYLKTAQPILLTAHPFPDFQCLPTPNDLTPEHGTLGHLKRLRWTQFELPKLYQRSQARLLFSPVPEAPIQTKCASVVTVHDLIPLRFPRFSSALTHYFRWLVPVILNQAEQVLCDSQATASDLVQFYGLSAAKITSIPLAFDASMFRPLNLPPQPYFVYVGRQNPYKNLTALIQAFALLPKSLDVELWLAGPPDPRYLPTLKQLATELGLGSRVKFLGYVPYDQLPILLNQAIALVFPSLWEGFGLPILEAMACGTPVISSNRASLPEVAGEAALLIDPENISALSTAMQAVVTDPQLRSQLTQAGLTQVQHFSWEKTARQTLEVIQRYL
jgi:glycosyltransferase involved in cell wall biosynthesis